MHKMLLILIPMLCLTLLCALGKLQPWALLAFLSGVGIPSPYEELRRRAQHQEEREAAGAAPPQPRRRTSTAPWGLPTIADADVEITQAGPPPLPETVAELGAAIAVAAEHPDERTRRLNADRAVQAARILQKAGGAMLLLHLAGCAHVASLSQGVAVGMGWIGALVLYALLESFLTTPLLMSRGRKVRIVLIGAAALGAIFGLMACTPAQRAAADRYGAAIAACGAREAPAAIQHGVSVALHAAAGADWQTPLVQLGAQFGRCLLDAEVLRYALGEPGPQVRSQASALRAAGELGAGTDPQPVLAELARQRATEWTTGGHR